MLILNLGGHTITLTIFHAFFAFMGLMLVAQIVSMLKSVQLSRSVDKLHKSFDEYRASDAFPETREMIEFLRDDLEKAFYQQRGSKDKLRELQDDVEDILAKVNKQSTAAAEADSEKSKYDDPGMHKKPTMVSKVGNLDVLVDQMGNSRLDELVRKGCGGRYPANFEAIKKELTWRTRVSSPVDYYVAGGETFPIYDYKEVCLIECDTHHLENILVTQPKLSLLHRHVIAAILRDRYTSKIWPFHCQKG